MKVYFAKTVNYKGVIRMSNTPFEIDPKDLPELKAAGCFLIEEAKPAAEAVVEDAPKKSYKSKAKAKEATEAESPSDSEE